MESSVRDLVDEVNYTRTQMRMIEKFLAYKRCYARNEPGGGPSPSSTHHEREGLDHA